jgi:gluconokinase
MPNNAYSKFPLVLTIDVGSSSARAILFDDRANAIDGMSARRSYEFQTTPDGGVEIAADALLDLVVGVLDETLHKAGERSSGIVAVAVSTFWHNLVGVDSNGRAITPVYSWADTRSAAAAETLRAKLSEEEVHARTGCVLHPNYLPAKLFWIQQTQLQVFRRVAHWMSFGEYLYLKFLGRTICSLSMASGTGLLDQNRCVWDEELLDAVSIRQDQLSPLGDLNTPLSGLSSIYSSRWPVLDQVPWFPALGDGACSNVGSGCSTQDRTAIMVGTSGAMRVMWKAEQVTIPKGLWCYHADRARFVMGGALSNGGLLFEWMRETLRLNDQPKEIEEALSKMRPASHGLTVLPFLAGERSTGWNPHARAAIVGLSLHTGPLDILRAGLEAVAYRFAKIAELLKQSVPGAREIVASGGALLKSPAWTQMMADVLGHTVAISNVAEASSRGAALLALEALGIVKSLEEIPAPLGKSFQPDEESHHRYLEGMKRQNEVYDLLIKPVGDPTTH